MDPLLPSFRRELRARAHHLHPVVSIGHHGLTPSVAHEIGVALAAHELVKVRVFSDERRQRDALLARICADLECAAVQQIGKLLVLWRPRPEQAASKPKAPGRAKPKAPERAKPARTPGAAAKPTTRPRETRRRRSGEASAIAPPPESARGRPAAGKAPSGVPRAAAPRRRRGR